LETVHDFMAVFTHWRPGDGAISCHYFGSRRVV
jgi:hypothetical protein